MACNGYYAQQGINVCINRSFIEQFPDTDIRKGLFLTEKTFLGEGESFKDVVDVADGMTTGAFATLEAYNRANAYVKATVPNAVEQNFSYASLKFQATGQPAVGCQPIIRNSELLLIQAEAAYYKDATGKQSQDALIALNKLSGRDVNYTCTKTGNALLEEIKSIVPWNCGVKDLTGLIINAGVRKYHVLVLHKTVTSVLMWLVHMALKMVHTYLHSGNGFFQDVKLITTLL